MSNELNEKELDFYQKLRRRIQKWLSSTENKHNKYADIILCAPDLFHLLVKLTLDPEVPLGAKAKLGFAVAYFMSPIDILPEFILGPIGFLDDIAVAAYVLNNVMNEVDKTIIEKHWAGDHDILGLINLILEKADQMLGGGAWRRVQQYLQRNRIYGKSQHNA